MPWKECVIVEQRMEFVRRSYEPGVEFKSLCQEYGISPKTGYKWLNRFELEGNPGLSDRSRRPRRHSHQLSEPEVCEMVKFKLAHPSWVFCLSWKWTLSDLKLVGKVASH